MVIAVEQSQWMTHILRSASWRWSWWSRATKMLRSRLYVDMIA